MPTKVRWHTLYAFKPWSVLTLRGARCGKNTLFQICFTCHVFRVAYTRVRKDRIGFSLLCRMLSSIHFVLHNPWNWRGTCFVVAILVVRNYRWSLPLTRTQISKHLSSQYLPSLSSSVIYLDKGIQMVEGAKFTTDSRFFPTQTHLQNHVNEFSIVARIARGGLGHAWRHFASRADVFCVTSFMYWPAIHLKAAIGVTQSMCTKQ